MVAVWYDGMVGYGTQEVVYFGCWGLGGVALLGFSCDFGSFVSARRRTYKSKGWTDVWWLLHGTTRK